MPAAARIAVRAIAPLMTQTPGMGALPTARAATDPSVLGGQFYGPDGMREIRGYPQVTASSPASYDMAVQQRLWSVSEELTGVIFPVA